MKLQVWFDLYPWHAKADRQIWMSTEVPANPVAVEGKRFRVDIDIPDHLLPWNENSEWLQAVKAKPE